MKNIIIVDIDTDRDPVVQIGKTDASELPKNKEEARESILKDMACLCEAVSTLIHAAHQSGMKDSADSLRDCINHLERGFVDGSYEAKVTKVEEIKEENQTDPEVDNKEE